MELDLRQKIFVHNEYTNVLLEIEHYDQVLSIVKDQECIAYKKFDYWFFADVTYRVSNNEIVCLLRNMDSSDRKLLIIDLTSLECKTESIENEDGILNDHINYYNF